MDIQVSAPDAFPLSLQHPFVAELKVAQMKYIYIQIR